MIAFQIPENQNAVAPAEYRGHLRDEVQMLVIDRSTGLTEDTSFNRIDSYLSPGDLLVFNNSRTIPAVLKGWQEEGNVHEVRLSRQIAENQWEALILGGFYKGVAIRFSKDLVATIIGSGSEPPLVTLSFSKAGAELLNEIYRLGEPIRYEYIESPWPLNAYQTVYAAVPGSVEMPSAGRAFTWKLIQDLKNKGIGVAFLQLHAGLSYYGNDEWPIPTEHPEAFRISAETARLINKTKENGGRIIAVGTTVVRALESAVNGNGEVQATEGITRLYIKKGFPLKAADGLLTGFHEPEASHLDLLTAFIEEEKLLTAYREALDRGYLWHEFGDMNLILPRGDNK